MGEGYALATHPDAESHKRKVSEVCGLIVSMIGQDEATREEAK
jgi:hypothetical protein